jgi:hypothetical protein
MTQADYVSLHSSSSDRNRHGILEEYYNRESKTENISGCVPRKSLRAVNPALMTMTSPPWSDSRDEIIVHNQRRIQDLHKEFTRSVCDLKSQFDDYGRQSEQIQQAMLNRIIDLKQQIREKE